MPFGQYEDFAACVSAQMDAGKTEAAAKRICGAMERDVMKIDMRVLAKADVKKFSLGVVYAPNEVDTDGEFAKADAIEAAAWAFMERLQTMAKAGTTILKAALSADSDGIVIDISNLADLEKGAGLDDMHLQVGDEEDLGTIVESYLAPDDMNVNGHAVKRGTWLMGIRWNQAMWAKVQKGERAGLSMFGRVDRVKGQPLPKEAA